MRNNSIISGVFWTMGERCIAQIVSFIVSIVLARLLSPTDYGVVAILLIFISIADVFVSNGFGAALIQKKDADQLDFSAVSSVGNISGIPFLLYDDHAFYKVKICVQLAKIFHLHQWEKERRIR